MHFLDFVKTIPDENAAREFVRKARWRDGVVCPTCKGLDVRWMESKCMWLCRNLSCRRQFSDRTGTLFEYSPIPLRKWLIGMFRFMADHRGISSLRLAKLVDVTHVSAYRQLTRLRMACQMDRKTPTDVVEIQGIHLDGKRKNQHLVKWRRYSGMRLKKQAVVGVFDQSGQIVHLGVMNDVPVMEVLVSTLAPGIISNCKHAHVLGEVNANNIESVLTLWKRIFFSTHLRWDKKYARQHMNEVTFRMNECLNGKSTVESMLTMIRNPVGLNSRARGEHVKNPFVRTAQV